MLKVLCTFNTFKQPSQSDISVFWWKAYFLYCYNVNNEDNEDMKCARKLKYLFHNDIKGPKSPDINDCNIPICKTIPHEWLLCLPCNKPVLLNYDINESKVEEILSKLTITGYNFTQISKMSQEVIIEQNENNNLFTNRSIADVDETFMCLDNECENITVINGNHSFNDNNNTCDTEIAKFDNMVDDNTEIFENIDFTDSKISCNTSKTKTPWQELSPSFKELTNTLDGVSNIDLIKKIKDQLTSWTHEATSLAKRKHEEINYGNGHVVSSSVPRITKKKSAPCNGYYQR